MPFAQVEYFLWYVVGPILAVIGTLAFIAVFAILFSGLFLVLLKFAAIGLAIVAVFFYIGGLYFLIFDFSGTMRSMSSHPEDVWIVAYTIVVTIIIIIIWYKRNRNRLLGKRAIKEETFTFKYRSKDQEENHQEDEQESFISGSDELRLRDLELLGLERTSSEDDIKKAYRSLSKKYHPDLNSDPHATIIFKQIQKAYNNLIAHSN